MADLPFLALVVWLCLKVTHLPSPGVVLFFTSKKAVFDVVLLPTLWFVPRLPSILKAAKAPGLEFFKSLSYDLSTGWVVYSVVLEKPGEKALLYIGSCTRATSRMKVRMSVYLRTSK